MIRVKKDEMIFGFLSLINILVLLISGKKYLSYVIFLIVIMLRLAKKINNEKFLLYILFIPNKYLQFIALPIYLLFVGRLIKIRINRNIIIFLLFVFTSGLINCLIYKGFVLATLFQIIFYYCVLILIYEFNKKNELRTIVTTLDFMFILQVFASALEILLMHGIGDNVKGTFESAHYFGVYLIVYMYLLIKIKDEKKSLLNVRLRFLLAFLIFVLADAKHVLIVMIAAFIISYILNKFNINKQLLLVSICILAGISASVIIIQSEFGRSMIHNRIASTYLFNTNYNKKYQCIVNTFDEMKSLNGIFGFGVGQYGSQISITMSKGIIYEWDLSLKQYSYAIEPYKRAISGLMTEWYTKEGINISSMVMGYPLVSIIGMIAELGIFGYLLLFYTIDLMYKGKNKTFIIAFMFLTIFDTYLEIACVFVLILCVTGICQRKGKVVLKLKE